MWDFWNLVDANTGFDSSAGVLAALFKPNGSDRQVWVRLKLFTFWTLYSGGEDSSSSYKALQPVWGSGLLNHFLPTLSILYYFLPVAYIHTLYVFQNVIFPVRFKSSNWSFGHGFPSLNPYPTAFPYGNGMVLHFYQQQESSMTKTVHKVINKGLKA